LSEIPKSTHLGETRVNGVVADDAPTPAALDQLIARDHNPLSARQSYQDLHHPRLNNLLPLPGGNCASCRGHVQHTKAEITFCAEIKRTR
jgi:hypothetical protein